MRFGDNMREVAVTEGDKVAAQAKLGWQVNTWPVGALGGDDGCRNRDRDRRSDDRIQAGIRFCDGRSCHGALSGARRDRDKEDAGCGGTVWRSATRFKTYTA